MGIYVAAFVLLLLPMSLDARPISYPGGFTLMTFSDIMKNSAYIHYSPSYKYSLGIENLKDKYFEQKYSYFRFTYLLDRKNTKHSQRNLYFYSGIRVDEVDEHFYGFRGDWETRRWFGGFAFKKTKLDSRQYLDRFFQLGIAPYLGDYGDLHTWLMIKTKKVSLNDHWITYPVLKLFKGDFLIELGYRNRSEWDAHFMYRF